MRLVNCIKIGSAILSLICVRANGLDWAPSDREIPENVLDLNQATS